MPPVVPTHAAVLRDFANTLDVDEGTDALTRPADLADWLCGHDLLDRRTGTPPAEDDLALARELRDAVRAAFLANHDDTGDDDSGPSEALEHVGERLPLALQVCGGRPRLEPIEAGVRGADLQPPPAAVGSGVGRGHQ